MIVKSAVDRYLNRPLRDLSELKQWSSEKLRQKINALSPQPEFITRPRHHQRVCFYLMTQLPRNLEFLGVCYLAIFCLCCMINGDECDRQPLNNNSPSVPELSGDCTLALAGIVFRSVIVGCVYLATNIVNGRMYVGKTSHTLERRRFEHTEAVRKGSHLLFHRAIRKYGVDLFVWEKLYRNFDHGKLLEREKFFIKTLRTRSPGGYNLTPGGLGGDTFSGRHHTNETKRKIRERRLGHRFNSSQKKRVSDGVKRARAAGYYKGFGGHKHSIESSAKISESLKAAHASGRHNKSRYKLRFSLFR